jgi:ADP-dependent NAD(P)H-hydrate dehydratase / NAD(P)H-hydrate epimerase
MQGSDGLTALNDCALLTTAEMAEADRLAIASGIPSLLLMENAGRAVADEAARMAPHGARIAVLCGPGNNGGDGFVAARLLAGRGHAVQLFALRPVADLEGDAGAMARRWTGPAESMAAFDASASHLIVDAMFGAGLSGALGDFAAQAVAVANKSGVPILSVDVPSGLDGTTGRALGPTIQAARTITFFRRKPGHLLLPGRMLCGLVVVADIGIPATVLDKVAPRTFANASPLWRDVYTVRRADGHKYARGHAVVISGAMHATGAARLGARGALRVGAGLVTVASPRDAVAVNAAHLTAIMIAPFDVPDGIAGVLADRRRNAVLIGPGCGVGEATCQMVRHVLESGANVVLDADALTSYAGRVRGELADGIAKSSAPGIVVTPHEGEFDRVFGFSRDSVGQRADTNLGDARRIAADYNVVVVLKGPATIIANPDGRAAISENAPPTLATAGSGDVLAGFVTGLLAQGAPAWQTACAAVWLHSECANLFGPGLIAEDLPELLPQVLQKLETEKGF